MLLSKVAFEFLNEGHHKQFVIHQNYYIMQPRLTPYSIVLYSNGFHGPFIFYFVHATKNSYAGGIK